MSSKQYSELQDLIDHLLNLGFNMSDIEEMLDLEIHVQTLKVQLVVQTVPSAMVGPFEVNMN